MRDSEDGKDGLKATITTADEKKQENYTVESWKLFQEALVAAKAMPETTEDEVNAKIAAIKAAIAKLDEKQAVPEVSKEALTKAIAAVKYVEVSEDGKKVATTEKWTTQEAKTALEEAVRKAQAVVDKVEANEEEIKGAIGSLAEAVKVYEDAKKDGNKVEEEKVDPAAGAKKEAEKITNKLTFEVADTDKADTGKVVEAAVTEAQKLVAEGYKVTTTGNGKIEKDKLTVTFIVTGNEGTNKAQTSELELTFTVAKKPVDLAADLQTAKGTVEKLKYTDLKVAKGTNEAKKAAVEAVVKAAELPEGVTAKVNEDGSEVTLSKQDAEDVVVKTNATFKLNDEAQAVVDSQEFKETYNEILKKTTKDVAISDKETVSAAIAAHEKLSEIAQGKLTVEKDLLDSLNKEITAQETATAAVEKYETLALDTDENIKKALDSKVKDKERATVEALTNNTVKEALTVRITDMDKKIKTAATIDSVEVKGVNVDKAHNSKVDATVEVKNASGVVLDTVLDGVTYKWTVESVEQGKSETSVEATTKMLVLTNDDTKKVTATVTNDSDGVDAGDNWTIKVVVTQSEVNKEITATVTAK